jgi:hypothetical protein
MLKERITISEPKKILAGDLAGAYACEVYLPNLKTSNPIYADSPNDATDNARKFVKIYLKRRIEFLENLLKEKESGIGRKSTEEELE